MRIFYIFHGLLALSQASSSLGLPQMSQGVLLAPMGVTEKKHHALSLLQSLSTDPDLSRDISIGEFLVAFGICRDVICSVYA